MIVNDEKDSDEGSEMKCYEKIKKFWLLKSELLYY